MPLDLFRIHGFRCRQGCWMTGLTLQKLNQKVGLGGPESPSSPGGGRGFWKASQKAAPEIRRQLSLAEVFSGFRRQFQ